MLRSSWATGGGPVVNEVAKLDFKYTFLTVGGVKVGPKPNSGSTGTTAPDLGRLACAHTSAPCGNLIGRVVRKSHLKTFTCLQGSFLLKND